MDTYRMGFDTVNIVADKNRIVAFFISLNSFKPVLYWQVSMVYRPLLHSACNAIKAGLSISAV
jgi:hypothetical protein